MGNQGWENLHRINTLAAKRLADFIRSKPEGVTYKDIEKNGLTMQGLHRLIRLGHVTGEQIREPERGPRAYHWLWKASTPLEEN